MRICTRERHTCAEQLRALGRSVALRGGASSVSSAPLLLCCRKVTRTGTGFVETGTHFAEERQNRERLNIPSSSTSGRRALAAGGETRALGAMGARRSATGLPSQEASRRERCRCQYSVRIGQCAWRCPRGTDLTSVLAAARQGPFKRRPAMACSATHQNDLRCSPPSTKRHGPEGIFQLSPREDNIVESRSSFSDF